jgi:hypothetical protein
MSSGISEVLVRDVVPGASWIVESPVAANLENAADAPSLRCVPATRTESRHGNCLIIRGKVGLRFLHDVCESDTCGTTVWCVADVNSCLCIVREQMKDREVIPCLGFDMSWCLADGRRTCRPSVNEFRYLVCPKFDPDTVGSIRFLDSFRRLLRCRVTTRVLLFVRRLRWRSFGRHLLLRELRSV